MYLFSRLTMISLLAALAGCTDPLISIPGGKLKGNVSPAPAAWSPVPDVVQVEFRPEDPYSINIWAVVAGDNLYIATRDAKWVPYAEKNSNVRIRVNDTIYEVTAQRVTDESEALMVSKAYGAKYDYEMFFEESLANTDIFRLAKKGV